MADFGITSYGAYVPRLRLDRALIAEAHKWMAPSLRAAAKGNRAFCSWDEDAATMAVEAARDCLIGQDKETVRALTLASTRLPYADLQNSAIVARALMLRHDVGSFDVASSQRAGTSGLIQALKAGEPALVVAADRPLGKPASVQEVSFGAGAAAFMLGSEKVIARCLGAATVTEQFVDHFRAAGATYDYFWEERWIRDEGYLRIVPVAIKEALARSNIGIAGISHFVMPSLQRGAADACAKKVGFQGTMASDLENGCGYAGAAHAPLMLAATLEQAKPGDRILVVGFGQGADAVVLEVTDGIHDLPKRRGVSGALADAVQTDSYLRLLSFSGGIDLEWGMRSEKNAKTPLTEQHRSRGQIEGFVAGRCQGCGTVQFPQLDYCVNPECHRPAAQFDQVPLIDQPFRVMTFTADWLSYHPAPPLYVGFVQFENGARLLMEIADVGPKGIDIGTPLRAIFRIKEQDRIRGYSRYFWKATPIEA